MYPYATQSQSSGSQDVTQEEDREEKDYKWK